MGSSDPDEFTQPDHDLVETWKMGTGEYDLKQKLIHDEAGSDNRAGSDPLPRNPFGGDPGHVLDQFNTRHADPKTTKPRPPGSGPLPKRPAAWAPKVVRTPDTDNLSLLLGGTTNLKHATTEPPPADYTTSWSHVLTDPTGGASMLFEPGPTSELPIHAAHHLGTTKITTTLHADSGATQIDHPAGTIRIDVPAPAFHLDNLRSTFQGRELPVTHEFQVGEKLHAHVAVRNLAPDSTLPLHANHPGLKVDEVRRVDADHLDVVMHAPAAGKIDGMLVLSVGEISGSDMTRDPSMRIAVTAESGPASRADHGYVAHKSSGRPRNTQDAGERVRAALRMLYETRHSAIEVFNLRAQTQDAPPQSPAWKSILVWAATTALNAVTGGLATQIAGAIGSDDEPDTTNPAAATIGLPGQPKKPGGGSKATAVLKDVFKVIDAAVVSGASDQAKATPQWHAGRLAQLTATMLATLNEDQYKDVTGQVTSLTAAADELDLVEPQSGMEFLMAVADTIHARAASKNPGAAQTLAMLEALAQAAAHDDTNARVGSDGALDMSGIANVSRFRPGDVTKRLEGPTSRGGVIKLQVAITPWDGRAVVTAATIGGMPNQDVRDALKGRELSELKIPIVVYFEDRWDLVEAGRNAWSFGRNEAGTYWIDERNSDDLASHAPDGKAASAARLILEHEIKICPTLCDG